MTMRRLAAVLVLLGVLSVPSLGFAQSNATGSIAGVAKDASGAVLPGVTVEAASPALIEKVRSVVTDSQGQYKLIDLRPGVYSVTFTLPGFSTFKRDGLELSTGFTAAVNAEMKVGALEETITVSGASPVVDVQNVRQTAIFRKEVQEALPLGKYTYQWAAIIPGTTMTRTTGQDVGGLGSEGVFIGIHGSIANDSALLQDGMSVRAPAAGWSIRGNSAATEETTVQTSGISAESSVGSVTFNVVPRDGSNMFKMNADGYYTNGDLMANNVDAKLLARGGTGLAPLKTHRGIAAGFGGPLKKDRLWFFAAHKKQVTEQYQPGNYYNKTQDTLFYTPDFSKQGATEDTDRDTQFRVTWQANPKNKVSFHGFLEHHCECRYYASFNRAPEVTARIQFWPIPVYQSTWTYAVTNRLLVQAGGMINYYTSNKPPQPEVTPDTISISELSNGFLYGSIASGLTSIGAYGRDYYRTTNQRFAVSYVTGSHSFKFGMTMMQAWQGDASAINHDLSYTFRNRVPVSVTYWATPTLLQDRVREAGFYGQDQWTIKNLTLNYGVRLDTFRGYVPEQILPAGTFVPERRFAAVNNVPNWKDITPRLGAAYDIRGNGKTAVKASLGRYPNLPLTGVTVTPNNPQLTVVSNATRTWNDVNGDYIPQASELGPLSNSNFGRSVPNTRFADDVLHGWGVRPYNWQGSVSVQQELWPGIGLNVGYFRTWFGNFTTTQNLLATPADYDPYCVTLPVDARIPGGGGNKLCGLYDIKPAKFGLVDNLVAPVSQFGKQTQVYNGVDVTTNMRLPRGAFVTGGMSIGRTVTDNCDLGKINSPQTVFCHVTPPWATLGSVKFAGIAPLPLDFRLSVTYQNIAGIPRPGSFVFTNAQIAPSLGRDLGQCRGAATCNGTVLLPNVFDPTSMYERRLTQVDMRVTRIFRIQRAKLQANFDLANIFNDNSVLQLNDRIGPAWLQPGWLIPGRLAKLGFQIDM